MLSSTIFKKGLARLTNGGEGWRYGIQALFSDSQTSIIKYWLFAQSCSCLKTEHFNVLARQNYPTIKYQTLKGNVHKLMEIYRDKTDV